MNKKDCYLFIIGSLVTSSVMALRTQESDIVLSAPPALKNLALQGTIGSRQQILPVQQKLTVSFDYEHPSGIPEGRRQIEYFLIEGPQKTLLSTAPELDLDVTLMAGKTIEVCVTLEAAGGSPNKSAPYCTSRYVSIPRFAWQGSNGGAIKQDFQARTSDSVGLQIRLTDEFNDTVMDKMPFMISLEQRDRQGNVRGDSGALVLRQSGQADVQLKAGESHLFTPDASGMVKLSVTDPAGIGVASTLAAHTGNHNATVVIRGRVKTSPDVAAAKMWGNMDEVVNGIARPRLYTELLKFNISVGIPYPNNKALNLGHVNPPIPLDHTRAEVCTFGVMQSIPAEVRKYYQKISHEPNNISNVINHAVYTDSAFCKAVYGPASVQPLQILNEDYGATTMDVQAISNQNKACEIVHPGSYEHDANKQVNYSKIMSTSLIERGWPNAKYASQYNAIFHFEHTNSKGVYSIGWYFKYLGFSFDPASRKLLQTPNPSASDLVLYPVPNIPECVN